MKLSILTLLLGLLFTVSACGQTEGRYVSVRTVTDVYFQDTILNIVTSDTTFRDTIFGTGGGVTGPAGTTSDTSDNGYYFRLLAGDEGDGDPYYDGSPGHYFFNSGYTGLELYNPNLDSYFRIYTLGVDQLKFEGLCDFEQIKTPFFNSYATYGSFGKPGGSMFISDDTGLRIRDFTTDSVGLVYEQDLSAKLKENPRAVPDVGTVQEMIDAGGGVAIGPTVNKDYLIDDLVITQFDASRVEVFSIDIGSTGVYRVEFAISVTGNTIADLDVIFEADFGIDFVLSSNQNTSQTISGISPGVARVLGTVNNKTVFSMEGVAVVSVPGTLEFKAKQNQLNANPTTIYAGSHLILTKLE